MYLLRGALQKNSSPGKRLMKRASTIEISMFRQSLFLAKLTYNFNKRIFYHGCFPENVAGFYVPALKQPLFSSRFSILVFAD